jgi:hypothetical protein
MESYILSIISFIAFNFCCRQLAKSILRPIPFFVVGDNSKSALRVQKVYAIFAWGLMTGVFMLGLISSFYQVFMSL